MRILHNAGLLYYLFPFIFVARNKFSLIFSILLGKEIHKVKLKEGLVVKFKSSQFDIMLSLLAVLTYSTSYSIKPGNIVEFSFDTRNKFTIPLDNLSFEDSNLLEVLFGGTRHGADFITDDNVDFKDYRDKTFRITQINGKKIIETSNGIKFYLDAIHPGNTIVAPFVQNIHLINSHDDWNDKIVIDIGAECGDTPLYYANLGAKVYAIEPIKAHFEAMIRNFSLNPELAKKIVPINAAVGKDGMLTFFQNSSSEIAGMASYVYNIHGKNVKTVQVKGYSFESLLKEFNINHVDLFKIDCKGCEFSITENALKNVDRVKISHTYDPSPERELEDLLKILEKAGFRCILYRINPNRDRHSNRFTSHIYGKKILK